MSFLINDDEVWHNTMKFVMRLKLGIKFHSELVYESRYLKAKVREFNGVIKTNFLVMICQKKICIIIALLV